jgi:hypothetical protein
MADASVKKKKFGGAQVGAGRPPIPEHLKKVQIGVALPRWLIQWLDVQDGSRARVIEDALRRQHQIHPPDKEKI